MKLVFYGLDAYVRSHSDRMIYFSTKNPNADPNMFVPLDLAKTPAAAQAGKIAWGDVIVDDIGDSHRKCTTVCPWDHEGRRAGGVWIEEHHLALLRRLFELPLPDPKAAGEKLHELMSVRYYAEDPTGDRRRVGNRYLGYHAKLDRSTGKVQVWNAGTSGEKESRPVVIEKLDFDDPGKVDFPKGRHGHTEIGMADGLETEGALFLKDDFARQVSLESNKKPPSEGV